MKKTGQSSVSLIVLNYNGLKHLKEYFDSVFIQTLLPDEVIMFDNLSKDGSREFVKKNYPKVKIVTEDRYNTGTAAGSNSAFTHAKGEYVIFQSNDIRLDKNCVKELVKTLKEDKEIGIATSVLLNYYEEKKSGKYIIDNAGGIADRFGFGMQNYPNKNLEDIPETGEVFFSYGGSFIISRRLFKKVGGFDNRYFTLNDDIDLSWRVRLLGYTILYNKKSIVFHKISATLGPLYDRAIKRYWSERNILRTILKNTEFGYLVRTFPVYIGMLLAEMAYFLLRKRPTLFLADLKAIMWNIFYLPETLLLRKKIQQSKKRSQIFKQFVPKSFKLLLFKDFKRAL